MSDVDDRPNLLCDEAPFGSYRNQVTMVPPTHLGIDGPVGIDLCLASEVACLWALGIKTISSCCGHGVIPGYIAVAPIHAQEMGCLWYERDERNSDLYFYRPQTGCGSDVKHPTRTPNTDPGEEARDED